MDGKDKIGRRLINAHHDDYSKPFNVRWLCPQHHREWHKNNEAKNKGDKSGFISTKNIPKNLIELFHISELGIKNTPPKKTKYLSSAAAHQRTLDRIKN